MKTIANSIRNSEAPGEQSDGEQLAVIAPFLWGYILHLQSRATQKGVKFFLDSENIKAAPSILS